MEIKCQLDATEVFIAVLIACSTCFGHHCAHHQELKSIIQWLLPVVFRAVVFKLLVWCGAGGYVSGLQVAASFAGLVWSGGLCVRFAGCCFSSILQTGLPSSILQFYSLENFNCTNCCSFNSHQNCGRDKATCFLYVLLTVHLHISV